MRNSGHQIQADIDYIGAFLFETATEEPTPRRAPRRRGHEPHDPASLIPQDDPFAGLAEAPPPISGYRDANVAGMACWNCGHFTAIGDVDGDGDLDGICNLFEAKAEGNCTCDRFTAHSDLYRQSPHTSWQEDMNNEQADQSRYGPSVAEVDYSDQSSLAAVNFSSIQASEEDGLVWKEILRAGKWPQTPTSKGVIDRELRIVDDGESDPVNGIISLAELESNFNDGAVPYVTVPLSDDINDHKNIARLNTGFVRKLRRKVRDGVTVLEAGIHFTEPDVKGKVLRGTIPDVSAGIPFGVTRRSDKKLFKAVLDHVCLTRRPFVDKLTPFGIAAADGDELPTVVWEQETTGAAPSPPTREGGLSPTSSENSLSFRQQAVAIRESLTNQLRLGPEYQVEDINGAVATISHRVSKCRWTVPFRLTGQSDNPIVIASVDKWRLIEDEPEEAQAVVASDAKSVLHRAQELRELRLSQPTSTTGGIQMPPMTLDGVELSNVPEEARARIQAILSENATLKRVNTEGKVSQRIEELKALPGLNLADRPGALKLYREVMLSDDGGPAIVLLADNDDESKRERLTALEILDRFITGLQAGAGIQFSDQHFASGNDNPPPRDASGERRPLDERVEETKKALYGDKNKRRTGRK